MNELDQMAMQMLAAERGIWPEYYHGAQERIRFGGLVPHCREWRLVCEHGNKPDWAAWSREDFMDSIRASNFVDCRELFIVRAGQLYYSYLIGQCEDCGIIHAVRTLAIGEHR
jgi:hypothetical protein